ncbi:cytoplasmic protein [Bacillus sp. AFS076308]|uniref:ribonuclease E inhibitor RraB n=1 Tax=unclassified Bacillus (in: firmicutes) TaxID=185979 RepID=UPI000BF8BE7A|nr:MULTISPECIES: ribonuclease E inhibitor RraB [unclassified Bacillus (in: firmicutes)]PFO03296.1 cytoplasmic protein [Bacillus sp. AFS076308]PGV48614.1 cytoplasmic protein [Bacillus sp. AFS037270]
MILFPKKFPNDEDGQVLKMLYKDGVDFKKPQNVDFFVAVPDKKSGEAVLKLLSDDGFNYELEQDEETEDWTCYCFVKMLLIHEDIVDIQKRLNELSKPYNVYSDGWGVMVD